MTLYDLVEKYGKDNLVISIPMRPLHDLTGIGLPVGLKDNNDPQKVVNCKIDERKYPLDRWGKYKIGVSPIDQKEAEVFGYEDFYEMDLTNLIIEEDSFGIRTKDDKDLIEELT